MRPLRQGGVFKRVLEAIRKKLPDVLSRPDLEMVALDNFRNSYFSAKHSAAPCGHFAALF